ncbi:metal-dependent hydrolase [Pseudoduganella chitinolytica]|uniref:Metal-dependent hydrolase n=1 Tax=Pseudoduganella chitinolytica TaxID=34070 RepID=A0ABY8BA54_9BURK|nr:metal-dependent hydrolase [Pseudoduganella chitinolytica]WEF32804.1 metal-dependent hydrolase [Pseudoduganella chitinolytica]
MDNITHSFVGLGVGELVQRSLPAEPDAARQRTRHRLLLTACAAASNFPDLDLFLTHLLPAPLGYLLHHRGHTHTLLYALPQALLLLALLWALWPNARRLLRTSGPARLGLGLAIVLGFCLHLSMDFLNSYGIHPFYPFDPRWFYGDMVFIVEPVFWIAFGVPLALAIPHRLLRAAALTGLVVFVLGATWRGYLDWRSLAALLVIGGAIAALRVTRRHSRCALALAAAIAIGFIAVQGATSALGRQRITAALQAIDPAARVLDVAMTAYPAQPLCWAFVSIESNEAAGQYRLRRGSLSLAPAWMPVASCPGGFADPAAADPAAPGIALAPPWQGDLALLRTLARSDCHVNAWLRYARMPAVTRDEASDLRYAATPRGNFTALPLEPAGRTPCGDVPRWGYPRADLLGAALR